MLKVELMWPWQKPRQAKFHIESLKALGTWPQPASLHLTCCELQVHPQVGLVEPDITWPPLPIGTFWAQLMLDIAGQFSGFGPRFQKLFEELTWGSQSPRYCKEYVWGHSQHISKIIWDLGETFSCTKLMSYRPSHKRPDGDLMETWWRPDGAKVHARAAWVWHRRICGSLPGGPQLSTSDDLHSNHSSIVVTVVYFLTVWFVCSKVHQIQRYTKC